MKSSARRGFMRGGVSRYYKGRSREYRAMGSLKADGWLCSRSAASHGPVDIFAGKGGRVLLVQVKGDRAVSGVERMELVKWAKAYGARAEVWYFGRSGIEREVVYEPAAPARQAEAHPHRGLSQSARAAFKDAH